jgi:NADH-quinone oxidoreductase subunit L
MAFHGEPRFDPKHPPHESPAVVTIPLVLLAIPSVAAGWWIGSVVFGSYFGASIVVRPEHGNVAKLAADYHGLWGFMLHGMSAAPFWLALAGIATAWYLYRVRTDLPGRIAQAFGPLYALVERKYGFDELYSIVFAAGARAIGTGFWKGGDQRAIDGVMVNGTARLVGWFSGVVRLVQSGLVYWYAFMMIFGVCAMYVLVKYRVFG